MKKTRAPEVLSKKSLAHRADARQRLRVAEDSFDGDVALVELAAQYLRSHSNQDALLWAVAKIEQLQRTILEMKKEK
jgi:hypothetical protein